MKALVLALACAGAAPATGQQDGNEAAAARAALERFTSPSLTRFTSEEEFAAYVEALEDHPDYSEGQPRRRIQFAQAEAQPDVQQDVPGEESPCPPDHPGCAREFQSIVVTGSSVTPSNPSITNNQMRNVDEGDIVKQIGNHLLVLSDGRIFVVDTRPNGRRGLALSDRVDVYRDPESDTWYDEMLVFGDRVLITGYSYDDAASELSVFRLSPEGRLAREGVFHISSNDYYDSNNYATRLIGDRLVIYTPIEIGDLDEADDGRGFDFPVVRRWLPREEREEAERRGTRLFDARGIFRPVRTERNPTIHTVSVCPLGQVGSGGELECRSTAVLGPAHAEWYVTGDEVFLWTARWPGWDENLQECAADAEPTLAETARATVFRVPHSGEAPTVAGARGLTFDQFSLQSNDGRLRALLDRRAAACQRPYTASVQPVYFDAPLTAFAPRLAELPDTSYTPVPSPGTRWIANRFTEDHLVYGGLSRYRSGIPEIDWSDYADNPERLAEMRRTVAIPPAYALPADRPGEVRRLDIGHSVIRAERAGDNIVLTGYRDRSGLWLSLIDLDGRPRVGSSIALEGRFESEGRSHAFNSLVEPSGSGVIGLPTSPKRQDSNRFWWRSRASDVNFLSLDRNGLLADLGRLDSSVTYDRREDEDGLANYDCEVSCIDWYGNSRPIFTDGRVFALSGVELIEGRLAEDRIFEVRRFDYARARTRVAAR
jgi:hypothetical protein